MTIDADTQHLLIFATMAVYLLAFAATVAGRKKAGMAIYGAGFAVAVVSYAFRWALVRHVPLQNLFEVFLCLGMLVFPLSVFCRRFLKAGGETADMLVGVLLLFPAGFVFESAPHELPPDLQSWLFAPHVAAYMAAYVIMGKAAVAALAHLAGAPRAPGLVGHEEATYRLASLGFPLLTAGLILGSVWAKRAWGDYWNWDPKELWSLATWLVYVAYFRVRAEYGTRRPRLNSLIAVAGMAFIVITLLWVNLARIFTGLHSYAM